MGRHGNWPAICLSSYTNRLITVVNVRESVFQVVRPKSTWSHPETFDHWTLTDGMCTHPFPTFQTVPERLNNSFLRHSRSLTLPSSLGKVRWEKQQPLSIWLRSLVLTHKVIMVSIEDSDTQHTVRDPSDGRLTTEKIRDGVETPHSWPQYG